VIAGNHRDAWPTRLSTEQRNCAMLEAVHGVGELLNSGWKPKRTMIFASLGLAKKKADGLDRVAEQSTNPNLPTPPHISTMDAAVSGKNLVVRRCQA